MRPGIAGILPGEPASITAAHALKLRRLGFSGASVFLPRPDETPGGELRRVRSLLADAGVRVAQANAAYPSLVHPDAAQRASGIRLAGSACRAARLLDAVFLLIRPGSLSTAGDWRPHAANYAPETRERLRDSLAQIARVAEGEGVLLGLECHSISPLDTPETVRAVLDQVGSPALRYNLDAVNFIASIQDAYNSAALVQRVFAFLGEAIVGGHVKDACVGDRLVVHVDECAPAEGVFDLAALVTAFERALPDGYLLIEHLPDEKIPAAKAALDAVLARAGIRWRE